MGANLLMIAIGGAAGAMARYGVSQLTLRWWGDNFPWGTLAVNLLGCLCFGLIAGAAEGRFALSPSAKLLLLTGFMGAFTTFSTFAFETSLLIRDANWHYVALNVVAKTAAAVLLVILGMRVGQSI